MVAAGGPLVEYLGNTMHPRHLDLARRVISGCPPFDTLRLRKRLAWMLKVDEDLAESASAPQVHHRTINAVLRPIAPCLSPGCQADWGRLGAKDQVQLLWALPKRPTEVLYHMSGTGNELWAGLMVWASRQVGGASVGVPVTPLPKGLLEIRDWPLEVLRGAFEASTLPITTVEAMGHLLGDITPSWASAPVLALLASRSGEPPLSAMSWTRVSSRAGGSGVTGDNAGPVGVDTPPLVDADAEGDDDPTQTFVNVDGVDPTVTDPWRALEAPTDPPATLALTFPEGGSLPPPPPGGKSPLGDSPSNPFGVNRTIQFGANSIFAYDADTSIGGPLEDSPTLVVVPNPGGSVQGGVPMPATLQTPSRADGQGAQASMETTPRLSARPDQTGVAPNTTGAPQAPPFRIHMCIATHAPRGPAHMGRGRGTFPSGTPDVGAS